MHNLIFENRQKAMIFEQNIVYKIMENQKCSQCDSICRQENQLIQLPNCDHFICQKCSAQILNSTFQIIACNVCSAFTKKQDLSIKKDIENTSLKLIPSATNKKEQFKQKCEDQEQKILLDDDENQKIQQKTNDLCKVHNIHMDIICISDKQRICPHCALFGNHKDHRFKRIQDFEKDTTQKMKSFDQILASKNKLYQLLQKSPQNQIDQYLNRNKIKTKQEISQRILSFIGLLRKKQQRLLEQADSIYNQLKQFLTKQAYYKKKQVLKTKIQKWEEQCTKTKKKMMETKNFQKKIVYYFDSPLQIVSQGQFFIEELKNITSINHKNIESRIKEIQVCFDTQMQTIIQKCVKISKFNQNYCIVGMEFMEQQISDLNPFMDCTSSEIHLNSIDTVVINNSLQMDITSLADSCKLLAPQLTKTIKKITNSKTQIKSMKSIEKKDPKHSIINSKKKLNNSPSNKAILSKNSRVSQFIKNKSPSKILNGGSLKVILPGTEVKVSEVKQPQKIYCDFSKNTLTDFFDISDCNLPSDKVVEYVHRARRIHKIRGLKLASNHLNNSGFQKMIQSLKGVGNINLANNQITQAIFETLIKNKDRLDALKIINLSHNPICFDKKISTKIQELKKMGIIVIL